MVRLTTFLWSVIVVCLACLQLVASVDVARICERRCLYGRGGILCRCNAMHFKGKRSKPAGFGLPGYLYHGEHKSRLLPPENVKYIAHTGASKLSSRSLSPLSAGTSGSQISYGGASTSKALGQLLDNDWDSNRVNQFISGLRSLSHHARNSDFDKAFGNAASDIFHEQDLSIQSLYPISTWGNDEDDGNQGHTEVELLQPPRKSMQNFKVKSFGYQTVSGDVDYMGSGDSQSKTVEEGGDSEVKDNMSQSQADRENILPSKSEVQILRLQEALSQVLRGR